ncbi:MAG TPA: serine esterase [Fibrobacteria bacterium]|jgi:phospholipase/carboxylesterase|nr:serine esterase [Fibrobacteria bacterium]
MLSTRNFVHRYVPATGKTDRERVMVVLHGLGDSLNGYHFLPQAMGIPEMSYLLLNAPDSYYGGYAWYDFMHDPAPGIHRSRELLLGMLDELEGQGVPAADVFLFGFSQGCVMSVNTALRADKVLGGIVGVSGYVAFPLEYPAALGPAARSQKFLVTHGRRDPVLPFEPSREQFQDLKKMGLDVEFVAYGKDHTMLLEELQDIARWVRARFSQGSSAKQ